MTADKIQLPQEQSPELNKWLDSALDAKSQEITFTKPSPTDLEPNSPINISRFGFRNPDDLKTFLLSPAGETVKGEIAERLAEEEAIKERQQREQQEHMSMLTRLKALLLLWIAEEDSEAASDLRELIEEQNTKAINQSKQAANPQTQDAGKADKQLQETLARYNDVIKDYQNQQEQLQQEEQTLQEQLTEYKERRQALNDKEALFNQHMDAFEQETVTLNENLTKLQDMESKIEEYQNQIKQKTEEIEKLSSSENTQDIQTADRLLKERENLEAELKNTQSDRNELKADINKQLDEQILAVNAELEKQYEEANNITDEKQAEELAKNMQLQYQKLGALNDFKSALNGEKTFLNAEGNKITNPKEATYIVENNKQIVNKDGKSYLLNKNENINELSPERLNEANQEFEKRKPEMMVVKNLVKQNFKLEGELHDSRINETTAKLSENQGKQREVDNKIKLFESSRASLNQANADANSVQQNSATTAAPVPTPSSNKANASAMPIIPAATNAVAFFAKKFLLPFFNSKKGDINSHELFDEIDKKAKNPREAKEVKDYFKKALEYLGIGTIPSYAPLPHTTMQSLLKNMAQFGADPYKPNLTNLQSPADTAQPGVMLDEPNEEPEFNPSPFNTSPSPR